MAEKRKPGRPPKNTDVAEPEVKVGDVAPGESPGRVYSRDYRTFWGPHDKGAAKPAFCYPQRIDNLREEVRSMERNLEMGYISPERKMAYEARLKERKDRLESINEHTERVHQNINKDKDWWVRRRKELAEQIKAGQPSLKDIEKRRVNPYRIAKMEKSGFGEIKKEYIVISRALGEESNISFLQRD